MVSNHGPYDTELLMRLSSLSPSRCLAFVATAIAAGSLLQATEQESKSSSPEFAIDEISWIGGHWRQNARGRTTEELWMPPSGGLMLGMNRTVPLAGRTQFEYLRIEEGPEGIDYVASPGGQGATRFRLVEADEKYARFENPEHDFPTVIEYSLDGNQMVAKALGPDGKGLTYKFELAAELD